MSKLSDVKNGAQGVVQKVSGTEEFERRITAVGITPGTRFYVVQNEKKYPVLVDVRDTLLAVDRVESRNIEVEVW